jgi:chloramphenicol 3-O-phosphotransferase
LIAVVGPCASGKSLLVQALQERGYNAHEVLQEHSYVGAMWQRITQPDVLVYLDVSEETARQRRRTSAPAGWWSTLGQRLSHAREHADLYLQTDEMSPQEILDATLALLQSLSA